MKANELMVDDWVYLVKDYGRVKKDILKLGMLELYRISDGMFEVEPIPLTPEILEKNGWSKDIYSNESYDNEELECLSLWVGEDGKNKWWWRVGVELVTPINYVHEFQHALRLCGIEKEIEL